MISELKKFQPKRILIILFNLYAFFSKQIQRLYNNLFAMECDGKFN